MLENIWFIAAVWMGLALLASLISIRTGISVALVEIVVGVVVGNLAIGFEGGTLQVGVASANTSAGHLHHILQSTEWTNFLALLGSGVLTFLAGAEIDPVSLKANWRVSVLIGVLSFVVPFAVVWFVAQFIFGWPVHQAQIAGIALSTTSVAVVYAVMIEGGFSDTAMGKMILAACFITDFGTVLVLGTLSANYDLWLLLFVIVTLIVLWFIPRWTQAIITRLGATQVSEPEIKFILFVLFFLQNGIINQNQYTILVSVVIMSAFVPTLIAQKFFQPTVEMMQAWGRVYRRRLGTLSVEDIDTDGEKEIAPESAEFHVDNRS